MEWEYERKWLSEMKPMHLDIKDGYHWNHPNDFN